MPSISAVDIAKALSGSDFPAKSDELVKKAKANGAPEEVVKTIQELPKDRQFHSMADVEQEFSKAHR